MTNLDSILKCRNITFPTKVHQVKAMVFPVVMYGCESWTIKKAECQRIDAFELWCWRRLLRVPWTTRRSNQSILKEISLEYSLEGLMEGKNWLIGKNPDAEKDRRWEEKGMTEDEMAGWLHWHNAHGFGWTPGVGDGQGGLRAAVHGVTKSWTWLSDWTKLTWWEVCSSACFPGNRWANQKSIPPITGNLPSFLLPQLMSALCLMLCGGHSRTFL